MTSISSYWNTLKGEACALVAALATVSFVPHVSSASAGPVQSPEVTDIQARTPAHFAAERISRGVNISALFDVPPGATWALPFGEQDWQQISLQGFDHIRLPVQWHLNTGPAPSYTINPTYLAQVDRVIQQSMKQGLAVVLDVHNFFEFMDNPGAHTNRLYRIWEQLAEHYKGYPNTLYFEILNEPSAKATTSVMNPIYARCVEIIRQRNTAEERFIILGPGQWNHLDAIRELKVPANDKGIIVTFHLYEPFLFTHQGTSWTFPETRTTGVKYPGPGPVALSPDPRADAVPWVSSFFDRYNVQPAESNPSGKLAFEPRLRAAKSWSTANNVPIWCGEFGAYSTCDPTSRARWHADVTGVMRELQIPYAVWEWKAGFGVRGKGLHQALFGNFCALQLQRDGTLTLQGIPTRSYSIQSAETPLGPWQASQTVTLVGTNAALFSVSTASDRSKFFRVKELE